jgi:hypothetical protein
MKTIIEGATLLAVSLLLQAGAAAQQGSMGLRTPIVPGSPLQKTGALFNDTQLEVLLVNVSDREVTETVLGLVLEDEAGAVPATTQSGRVCKAKVAPGGFLAVRGADNGFDSAVLYFRDKGITEKKVTVGVTRVRFADGSEWVYPLEAKGHFDEAQPDDKLAQRIESLKKKQFGDVYSVVALLTGSGLEGKVSSCRD